MLCMTQWDEEPQLLLFAVEVDPGSLLPGLMILN